jgi:hypothetical protein
MKHSLRWARISSRIKADRRIRIRILLSAWIYIYIYIVLYILRFDVSTVMTMNNAVFWDIKTQFVPLKKHITCSPRSPAG